MDKDPQKLYRFVDRMEKEYYHMLPAARDPVDPYGWIDRHFPDVQPEIPNQDLEEEDPEEEDPEEEDPEEEDPEEEDPEEEDPEEENPEEEEYHPASEEEEEEYHPTPRNEDEDMGECYTPPSSQRIRPVLKKTAGMNVHPNDNFGTFHFEGMPSNPSLHFETGESSQTPPRNIPIPPPATPTIAQFNELVDQIRILTEREKSNSEAIQTLYHHLGASRTEANNLRAHNQTLSYQLEITKTRLDAAEHLIQEAEQERNLIRDEHDEIVRHFNDM